MSAQVPRNEPDTKDAPLDLSHHFSRASRKRIPNVLKEYYKFLRMPEMGNLAGGLPFPESFPFDSLEFSVTVPGILGIYTGETGADHSGGDPTPRVKIPRSAQALSSLRQVDLDGALQYGSAKGYPPLYAWLRTLTTLTYHPNIPYRGGPDIMVTGGSADGLSKVYDVLFNHWDEEVNDVRDREGLLLEEFVYAPPIAQARPRDINIVPVTMDGEGLMPHGDGSLSDVLENWDPARGKMPHVLYLIPTGQNPTSGVLSFPRRKQIYEICSKFDVVIIEDDPYWNLYYPSTSTGLTEPQPSAHANGDCPGPQHNFYTQSLKGQSTGFRFLDELVPSFLSIDVDGRVIRLDSFSKTIAPGCRLGWITAQSSICEQLFRVTDCTTQQPSGFVQAIVVQLLGDFGRNSPNESPASGTGAGSTVWGLQGWIQRLEGLRDTYRHRMITMATVLEENRFLTLPTGQQIELFSFRRPMGGMFIWVQMNIISHPLSSSVDPKRLMFALWILCTQAPYQILLVPGGDLAASQAIKDTKGFLFLRFCFAAVHEKILVSKSQAFVEACRKFWSIDNVTEINRILRDDDICGPKTSSAEDSAETDREIIGEW